MARYSFSVLVLLGFLAGAAAVAGAAGPSTTGGCETSALAAELAASCAAGAATTPPCCEPVVAAAELGAACLCRVASEMPVLHAGLDASALLALYAGCGGARTLPACHGPAPSVHLHIVGALQSTAVARRQLQVGAADSVDAACTTPSTLTEPEARVVHLPAKHKNILIALVTFQMVEIAAALGFVAYKVYRRFYART